MSEEITKSDTITIKKNVLWKYSTFVLMGILVLGLIFFVLPGKSPTGNVVADLPTINNPPPANANLEIQDGDYVKGNPNAEVTIFEFSDFECPFCGRFYRDTLDQITSEYIDTGKANFVYAHFPLTSIHAQAQKAAEAAECAGAQKGAEGFYAMHDMLFEKGVSGGVTAFKQYAADQGLNTAKYNKCLDNGDFAKKVTDDLTRGSSAGVRGTPGFVIVDKDGNGRLLSGAQPFSAFKPVIDSAVG